MPESTVEERELDLAALIALWYAIHGGDPSPSEVTIDDETVVLIAAALDRHLANTVEGVSREGRTSGRLEERLKSFGVEVLPKDSARPFCIPVQVKLEIPDIKAGTPGVRYVPTTIWVCFEVFHRG